MIIGGWKMNFPLNMVSFQGTFVRFRGGDSGIKLPKKVVHHVFDLKKVANKNSQIYVVVPP